MEEDKKEENPPLKGKRVASEDVEDGARPKGQKRLKGTSTGAAGKSSEKIVLSDESEHDPLAMGRKKPTPRGYVIVFMFMLQQVPLTGASPPEHLYAVRRRCVPQRLLKRVAVRQRDAGSR